MLNKTPEERARIHFDVVRVPQVCEHHNAVIISMTEDGLYHQTEGEVWKAHFHYGSNTEWCSTRTENRLLSVKPATNLPELAFRVFTSNSLYSVYEDGIMIRSSLQDGLITDAFVLNLWDTQPAKVGSRWRPYVKGHAGNPHWAGWLNTSTVVEVSGDANPRNLL